MTQLQIHFHLFPWPCDESPSHRIIRLPVLCQDNLTLGGWSKLFGFTPLPTAFALQLDSRRTNESAILATSLTTRLFPPDVHRIGRYSERGRLHSRKLVSARFMRFTWVVIQQVWTIQRTLGEYSAARICPAQCALYG